MTHKQLKEFDFWYTTQIIMGGSRNRSPSVWNGPSMTFSAILLTTQQTRHIYPMLDQHWPTVYDIGPTLVKHWIDVSCLLDMVFS